MGKSGSKLVGDWSGAKSMIKGMPRNFKTAMRQALPKVGLKGERIAVKFIQTQELGWEPLSEKYLAFKLRSGKSEKIYVKESDYMQAITSKVEKDSVFIGVIKKVYNEKGDEIADIALTLEYGSEKRGIPARPLWRPTYDELKSWLQREKFFAKEIVNHLKRIG